MDPLTSAATSGLRSTVQSLDMLANNLANVQTSGYKTDREFYDLYTSPDALEPGAYDPTQMPNIQKNWTDYSQGTLQLTSGEFDMGLSGDGFFSVNSPSGPLYTRNGAFRLNAQRQLVNDEGYTVRGSDGNPLVVDPTQVLEVNKQGGLVQGGQVIGQLALTSFAQNSKLTKQGVNYFHFSGSNTDMRPSTADVEQGKLEVSNVSNAESAVRLVTVMRHFETLQKAITIGTEMNKQAIEEVARSGS
jgi:flagellar basal-body rod protein FlgG